MLKGLIDSLIGLKQPRHNPHPLLLLLLPHLAPPGGQPAPLISAHYMYTIS